MEEERTKKQEEARMQAAEEAIKREQERKQREREREEQERTKRNLELTETLRLKQRNYSLIWLLDKTKTAMGSRMLKSYIENPLINIDEINRRYDVVEKLLEEFILKDDLKNLLYQVYDLERLSGRVAFGNANARDLIQLRNSLAVLPDINNILNAFLILSGFLAP